MFFINSPMFIFYYNLFFWLMNLIDQLDAQFHQNSLEIILGYRSSSSDSLQGSSYAIEQNSEPRNCVTYQWAWSDAEFPAQEPPSKDQETLSSIRNARIEQENKVKRYIGLAPPLQVNISRKFSFESKTEIGSPKTKRIRKAHK